jgi:hypothetical protein
LRTKPGHFDDYMKYLRQSFAGSRGIRARKLGAGRILLRDPRRRDATDLEVAARQPTDVRRPQLPLPRGKTQLCAGDRVRPAVAQELGAGLLERLRLISASGV